MSALPNLLFLRPIEITLGDLPDLRFRLCFDMAGHPSSRKTKNFQCLLTVPHFLILAIVLIFVDAFLFQLQFFLLGDFADDYRNVRMGTVFLIFDTLVAVNGLREYLSPVPSSRVLSGRWCLWISDDEWQKLMVIFVAHFPKNFVRHGFLKTLGTISSPCVPHGGRGIVCDLFVSAHGEFLRKRGCVGVPRMAPLVSTSFVLGLVACQVSYRVGPSSDLDTGSYTRAREVMIFCTIKSKPLALPWGRTPRLDSGVRVSIHCQKQGMNVEALQTKYPIIDWKIYTEGARKYWKIIRVGNHTKRLYDTCGVHHVSTKDEMGIYMLVEKEYPLSRGVLTQMLVAKLLVEQDNEMSRELLRKIFMQESLSELVSLNQSTFVPGRHISDNILLTQELMHNYYLDRGHARCAFKVDIKKAYDKVDWNFLNDILIGFGFHPRMIGWIMECVTSTSFSLSINGCLHGYFKGKRGLPQGDSMSPYLFTLIMEVFTLMLNRRVRQSASFTFHRYCSQLNIINICFADNLFLFAHGDVDSARVIMDALEEFKNVSGLTPNLPKSTAYFCNVLNYVKIGILNILPFEEGGLLIGRINLFLLRNRKPLSEDILGATTQRDTGSYYPKRYWELLPKEILGAITQRDTGSYYPKRDWDVLWENGVTKGNKEVTMQYLELKGGDRGACKLLGDVIEMLGCLLEGASCTQRKVSIVPFVFSIPFVLIVVVVIVGVVIIVAIIGVVVVVNGVSSILKLSFVIIGFLRRIMFYYLLHQPLGYGNGFLQSLSQVVKFVFHFLDFSSRAILIGQEPFQFGPGDPVGLFNPNRLGVCIPPGQGVIGSSGTGSLPSGRIDLTGDEDSTDEDRDTRMGDSTGGGLATKGDKEVTMQYLELKGGDKSACKLLGDVIEVLGCLLEVLEAADGFSWCSLNNVDGDFSVAKVWKHLKQFTCISNIPSDLNSIMDFITPLAKMRLFKKRTHDQLIEIIKNSVWLKLLTCSFKKTSNVLWLYVLEVPLKVVCPIQRDFFVALCTLKWFFPIGEIMRSKQPRAINDPRTIACFSSIRWYQSLVALDLGSTRRCKVEHDWVVDTAGFCLEKILATSGLKQYYVYAARVSSSYLILLLDVGIKAISNRSVTLKASQKAMGGRSNLNSAVNTARLLLVVNTARDYMVYAASSIRYQMTRTWFGSWIEQDASFKGKLTDCFRFWFIYS
ncbi:putative reverse transcriptase domain, reverse transcriptase zinc-binding domain protein [Tanacetum coccineum]|uniref:Reverse transcriptase domain, reverse transcriptase zinc-binding domain protein n=1 Tax=Tanacetum coccineum TaxID=301880 RepID=A0ABQ5CNT7_9ASTR